MGGVESKREGVGRPDKKIQWPTMTEIDRSRVYGNLAEKKITLKANLKTARNELSQEVGKDLLGTIESLKNYAMAKGAKEMMPTPVSSTILKAAMQAGFQEAEAKEVMFFSLRYLADQNFNADKVAADETITIFKDTAGRWKVKLGGGKAVAREAHLFPPVAGESAPAVAKAPPAAQETPAPPQATSNPPTKPAEKSWGERLLKRIWSNIERTTPWNMPMPTPESARDAQKEKRVDAFRKEAEGHSNELLKFETMNKQTYFGWQIPPTDTDGVPNDEIRIMTFEGEKRIKVLGLQTREVTVEEVLEEVRRQ